MVRAEGEVATRCINTNCPARLKESLLHFAARAVMDIDGMGEALVDQLVEKRLVRSIADIYELTFEQLTDLERMGEKSARKVLDNIEASRERPLPRLMAGLGIPFVGERTAQFLAERSPQLKRCARPRRNSCKPMTEVGPKVSESIRRFFEEPHNMELVDRLRRVGLA